MLLLAIQSINHASVITVLLDNVTQAHDGVCALLCCRRGPSGGLIRWCRACRLYSEKSRRPRRSGLAHRLIHRRLACKLSVWRWRRGRGRLISRWVIRRMSVHPRRRGAIVSGLSDWGLICCRLIAGGDLGQCRVKRALHNVGRETVDARTTSARMLSW